MRIVVAVIGLVFMVSCPVGAFVRRCLAALVDLTADENCRAQLVAEGLVPSLVALCSRSRDNTLLACAAACSIRYAVTLPSVTSPNANTQNVAKLRNVARTVAILKT